MRLNALKMFEHLRNQSGISELFQETALTGKSGDRVLKPFEYVAKNHV